MPNRPPSKVAPPLVIAVLLLASVQCRLATPQETPTGLAAITATPPPASRTLSSPALPTATNAAPSPTPTPTTQPSPTHTPTATSTPRPTLTATSSRSPTPRHHCAQPPDDYTRVQVRGHTLNARTVAMLQTAQQIYGGPGDLLRVVQGSYNNSVSASFGTHAGGGAVDISIRDPRQENIVLWDEAEIMVIALRQAGFAAWYRQIGDLGPGSDAHIHAIAIGDRELSPAAQEQVSGPGGYLNGMDGLIPPYGPNPDRQNGTIICPWMDDLDGAQ